MSPIRISDLSWLSIAVCAAACAGAPESPEPATPLPAPPVRTGNVHDFDFLAGSWKIESRSLKAGTEDQWVVAESSSCLTIHLGGVVNIDEYQFPTRGYSAVALRIFNLEKRQWSIYWIESRVGALLPPVMGGFDGDRGEFYGADDFAGRPALFRFVWNKLGPDRARWEQSHSFDGQKWIANWVLEFTRTGPPGCPAVEPDTPAPVAETTSTPIPTRTGGVHDFDYFAGAWTTRQRRLKERGVGSSDWDEFPGRLCMTPYLGGLATVDELHFPTKGWSGLTLRAFDVEKRQWSIYWVNGKTGTVGTPVVGGFQGNRGEFYGPDEDGGRPVTVRYTWTKVDQDHARWEQAFSYDGRTWETNWTADFTRADPAAICDSGRPRR